MVALWSPEYVCVYSLFRCPPVVKIPNNKALKKYIDGMIDGTVSVSLASCYLKSKLALLLASA